MRTGGCAVLAVLVGAVTVASWGGAAAGGGRRAAGAGQPGGVSPSVRQEPPPQTPPVAPDAGTGPAQVPVFRTSVDLVTVDVNVVDKDGQPVRGLTADDFALEVDGEPRRIASVEFVTHAVRQRTAESYSTNDGAAGGRLIMIVVDEGNIRSGHGTVFVQAAGRLLDSLGPGDRVAVAIIPGGRVVPFTNHFALVRQVLSRVAGTGERFGGAQRVSTAEALLLTETREPTVLREVQERECPQAPVGSATLRTCTDIILDEARARYNLVRQQTEMSLNALRQLLDRLGTVPGPKTVVVLSEGLVRGLSFGDVTWVSRTSASAQVTIYAIHLDDTHTDATVMRPSPDAGEDRALAVEGLGMLAGQARGAVFSAVAGTDGIFRRLSRELSGFYLLTFEPDPSERDGKTHEIRIAVKRRGVEVRSRRLFTASPVAVARKTDDDLLAEILRDPRLATEIRMRVASYNFPDPATAGVRVLLSVGLGRPEDVLSVQSVAYTVVDLEGKLVLSRVDKPPARDGGEQRYYTTFVVPAGTFTVKVAGVDADGRRGSVEHLFTAALASAGTIQTGDLMLAEPGRSGGFSMAPAIEPEIRGEGLAGYLEIRSTEGAALESASVALELAREPNAPTLLSGALPVEATKDTGRRIAQGLVPIGDLPAGEYVARAVVSISGRPVARVVRAFTYTPTSEVRRRALVAGGRAAEGGGVGLGFEPAQVLQPQVVSYFLDRKGGGGVREVPSSSVGETPLDAAIAAARAGRFDELASPAPSGADAGTSAFLQGLGLFSRGELEPAANAFRQALRADADFSGATFFLGACYAAGGKDREAVGAWQATLAVEDGAPFVYAVTADAHARLKEWDQAVDLAQEAVTLWPDDARARMRLVRALALAGRRADALTALDAHLSAQPADPDILLLGMKVLYDAAADAQPVAGAAADRQRFERYLEAYRAAGGSEIALAERWLQVLAPSPAGR